MHFSNVHTKTVALGFHEYSCISSKHKIFIFNEGFHVSMVIHFPHESLEYIY